jgi:hypothetical protein
MRRCSIIFLSLAISHVVGQPGSVPLKPPFGLQNQLVSPDGAYALFGDNNALWRQDERTHERRRVMEVTVQTLTVAWSPDSSAFIANDRALSDVENAYIYDLKTLERIDLRRQVLTADSKSASRFTSSANPAANHSYFHALRWLDARHVEMRLYGHTDGIPNGKPFRPGHQEDSVRSGDCFDLRYRVSRDGVVKKLSQRVVSLTSPECNSIE